MPVPVEELKSILVEAEMLLRIDSYGTDKFLFITPKMYKQLKDEMAKAARVAKSGTIDPVKVHIAKKDLEFAIQGARSDMNRPKRESITITYLEELLNALSPRSRILDELKKEKPVDGETMRCVLRSVREELSEDLRTYTPSGGSLTRESVAKFLKKLEDFGILLSEPEKQKMGHFEQQSPSSRRWTRF